MEKYQSPRLSHLKAICFDENPLYLQSITNGLGCLGITCFQCHSLEMLQQETLNQQHDYNLVLISLSEQIDDSIQRFLTANPIPTILVSKWSIPDVPSLCAKAFLFKPISIQKLQETIESLSSSSSFIKIPPQRNLTVLRAELREKNITLLIAEDNLVNQMLLKSLLSDYAQIHMVEDGVQAVEACRQKRYDIILLDLQMPNLNGLQAAEQIRNHCLHNQETAIIAITANNKDLQSKDHFGIDFCLHKPIDEKQLLTQLLLLADLDKNAAINWKLCVQKVSGNSVLAREYLSGFVKELHHNRQEFLDLLQVNNFAELANSAHKLLGACCFCGVPKLQAKVIVLEKQAKIARKKDDVNTAVNELIEQIDAIINEFAAIYDNCSSITSAQTQ